MFKCLKRLKRDDRGATSIEYALVASLIFSAVVGTWGPLADAVRALYDRPAAAMIAAGDANDADDG